MGIIRNAELTDTDAVMAVEKTGISHPWTRDSIESCINDDNKITLVACSDDGSVEGYIYASFVLDEAEIGNICVLPQVQGRGIGRRLMDSMIDNLRSRGINKVFLEVESDNAFAISLYEKCGFTRYNVRKGYYGEGRDALLYSHNI